MLNTIRSYTDHTLIGIIAEGLPALGKNIGKSVLDRTRTVHLIAIHILYVGISFVLWYLHHNLFAFGFVIGFIFDKQIAAVAEKVNVVYSANLSLLQYTCLIGGGGFFAILTMPMSFPMAAFYCSTQWGSHLYQYCLSRSPIPPPSLLSLPLGKAFDIQINGTVYNISIT